MRRNKSTDLIFAVRLPVVRGAHGQNDDHDEESPARGQDCYQGSIIRRFLGKQESGWLVFDQRCGGPMLLSLTLVISS